MAASYSIDEQVITCGKRLISFLRKGKGPPLILLHGIGSSAASWQAQLDGLSDHYDVIAWNAPGYSQSTSLEDAAPATVAYADALAQLLEQLNIDKCFLAGHLSSSLFSNCLLNKLFDLTFNSRFDNALMLFGFNDIFLHFLKLL